MNPMRLNSVASKAPDPNENPNNSHPNHNPNTFTHLNQNPNISSHPNQNPNTFSHPNPNPNASYHFNQNSHSSSHQIQYPHSSSHSIQNPNTSSHLYQNPNTSSHLYQNPNNFSHSIQNPNISSHPNENFNTSSHPNENFNTSFHLNQISNISSHLNQNHMNSFHQNQNPHSSSHQNQNPINPNQTPRNGQRDIYQPPLLDLSSIPYPPNFNYTPHRSSRPSFCWCQPNNRTLAYPPLSNFHPVMSDECPICTYSYQQSIIYKNIPPQMAHVDLLCADQAQPQYPSVNIPGRTGNNYPNLNPSAHNPCTFALPNPPYSLPQGYYEGQYLNYNRLQYAYDSTEDELDFEIEQHLFRRPDNIYLMPSARRIRSAAEDEQPGVRSTTSVPVNNLAIPRDISNFRQYESYNTVSESNSESSYSRQYEPHNIVSERNTTSADNMDNSRPTVPNTVSSLNSERFLSNLRRTETSANLPRFSLAFSNAVHSNQDRSDSSSSAIDLTNNKSVPNESTNTPAVQTGHATNSSSLNNVSLPNFWSYDDYENPYVLRQHSEEDEMISRAKADSRKFQNNPGATWNVRKENSLTSPCSTVEIRTPNSTSRSSPANYSLNSDRSVSIIDVSSISLDIEQPQDNAYSNQNPSTLTSQQNENTSRYSDDSAERNVDVSPINLVRNEPKLNCSLHDNRTTQTESNLNEPQQNAESNVSSYKCTKPLNIHVPDLAIDCFKLNESHRQLVTNFRDLLISFLNRVDDIITDARESQVPNLHDDLINVLVASLYAENRRLMEQNSESFRNVNYNIRQENQNNVNNSEINDSAQNLRHENQDHVNNSENDSAQNSLNVNQRIVDNLEINDSAQNLRSVNQDNVDNLEINTVPENVSNVHEEIINSEMNDSAQIIRTENAEIVDNLDINIATQKPCNEIEEIVDNLELNIVPEDLRNENEDNVDNLKMIEVIPAVEIVQDPQHDISNFDSSSTSANYGQVSIQNPDAQQIHLPSADDSDIINTELGTIEVTVGDVSFEENSDVIPLNASNEKYVADGEMKYVETSEFLQHGQINLCSEISFQQADGTVYDSFGNSVMNDNYDRHRNVYHANTLHEVPLNLSATEASMDANLVQISAPAQTGIQIKPNTDQEPKENDTSLGAVSNLFQNKTWNIQKSPTVEPPMKKVCKKKSKKKKSIHF